MIVIALVYAGFPWLTVAPLLMGAAMVYGVAVGTSQPNMLSLLHTHAPAGRGGEAVGLRSVLSNVCSVLVPVAFGAALASISISTLLYAGAAVFGMGVVPAHRAVEDGRRVARA